MLPTEDAKGGGHGKYFTDGHTEYECCPHTRPLARWLQRVIMWNTGKEENYFKIL